MKRSGIAALFLAAFATLSIAQSGGPAATPANYASEKALAQKAFEAHGGEKLRAVKTLVVRGSADITMSAFPQQIPGGFAMVIAGDRYILELTNAMQSFKQAYDGRETTSTVRGMTLPPITSLGLPLLQRLGDAGYVVTPLPVGAKKRHGFRITAPDASYTDFRIDEKTSQIAGYESTFEVNGNKISTSAEIDKYRIVDGVSIPEKYAQRFDLGNLTAYASFKAKEILINQQIDSEVFTAGK